MEYATWIYDLNLDRTYIARLNAGDGCYYGPLSLKKYAPCDALYSVQ
jgi:hypothetical protein